MPNNRRILNLINEALSNFRQIRKLYDPDKYPNKANKIIGTSCLLANIETLDEMQGRDIFSDDFFEVTDYETCEDDAEKYRETDEKPEDFDEDFEVEDVGPINLSKRFLSKSVRKFNFLLNDFANPNNRFSDEALQRNIKILEERLLILVNGKIDLINRNGIYSFYVGVREGYITYEEFGRRVESLLEGYRRLISSKQD